MPCDHNTITDLDLNDNEYYIVHCDSGLISSGYVKNKITTAHEVETFKTPQAHINRGLALGLEFKPGHLIRAMEAGATIPKNLIDNLRSVVWNMHPDYTKRMEALGHTKP